MRSALFCGLLWLAATRVEAQSVGDRPIVFDAIAAPTVFRLARPDGSERVIRHGGGDAVSMSDWWVGPGNYEVIAGRGRHVTHASISLAGHEFDVRVRYVGSEGTLAVRAGILDPQITARDLADTPGDVVIENASDEELDVHYVRWLRYDYEPTETDIDDATRAVRSHVGLWYEMCAMEAAMETRRVQVPAHEQHTFQLTPLPPGCYRIVLRIPRGPVDVVMPLHVCFARR
jgi:hypothetical protein